MSLHHSYCRFTASFFALLAVVSLSAAAPAATVWDQGFETDTSGWLDANSGWSGTVARVASGTNGIASNEGAFHAEFAQSDGVGGLTGPFSRFDMYRDTWPGGFTASVDVYLDTAWADGEGFDYAVAASNQAGAHRRDFIFHVAKDASTGDLLVGGSNNTNFNPRTDLESRNHYDVNATGWYTLEHVFRDAGDGTLAVDLNLLDSAGGLLFTETRNDASDVIATEVGGNRYGWFTNIDVAGGIEVDAHSLSVVPEPTTLGLAGAAMAAVFLARRRRVAA